MVRSRLHGRHFLTMMTSITPLLLFFFLHLPTGHTAGARRNVVIFLADGLGWREIGSRDPEMRTPNIDNLAAFGVTMNSSYMAETGTASRAAFFTGIFPAHLGMQHSVSSCSDVPLPLNVRILPQDLKDLGYSTHYVGKWQLGSKSLAHTPTYRGFDTFYGMYGGEADYFTHITATDAYDIHDNKGQGLNRQFSVDTSANGTYSTTLFTDKAVDIIRNHDKTKPLFLVVAYQAMQAPLQAPNSYISRCCGVTGSATRKLRCAALSAMDDGVGEVLAELKAREMDQDLVTLFTSDNGGCVESGASNWPLRGSEGTLWEGGTRVVSILRNSDYLGDIGYTWNGMMHAVDWYRTLLRSAGQKEGPTGIDGVDNWVRIRNKKPSARIEFIYGWNDVRGDYAIRFKDFKFLKLNFNQPSGWYFPPSGQQNASGPVMGDYPEYLLYDVIKDPQETKDLGQQNTCQVELLKVKMAEWQSNIEPPL